MTEETNIEYKRFILSLIPPAIIIFFICLVKVVEVAEGIDLFYYGIFPRKISGLTGIFLSPFIHSNFSHLANNSVPFFFLLTAIFYFYQKIAWKVLFISYLFTGALVWLIARPSYHVGASGIVYNFASFLFFSGIIRRNVNLLAISMLVVFLYGSMVWGLFPYRPDMSWESHLAGALIGAILAVIFKHEGPGPTKFISDMDDEDDQTDPDSETDNESSDDKKEEVHKDK